MAKIYKITSRGKTWEQVANNASEIKQLVAAKFGMKKMPKGTQVVKVGLTKGKAESSPSKPSKPSKRSAKAVVVSKQQRFDQKEKRKQMSGQVLTGPDGATYTVGQRGRVPLWVREQLGEVVEEAPQEQASHAPTDTKAQLVVSNWLVANKNVTISAVSYAVESNGKVTCEYASNDCEVVLTKGTKYSILMDHKE